MCYVCEEVSSKLRLICVGPSRTAPGEHIFRHEECACGSPRWLKFYRDRSSFGSLFRGMGAEGFSAEQAIAAGRLIVEERRAMIENEIAERLDGKKRSKEAPSIKSAKSGVVVQRSKKKRGSRHVIIRRVRNGF